MTSTKNPPVFAYKAMRGSGISVNVRGARVETKSVGLILNGVEIEVPDRSIITLRMSLAFCAPIELNLNVATNELGLWPFHQKTYRIRAIFQDEGLSVLYVEPPEGSVDPAVNNVKGQRGYRIF